MKNLMLLGLVLFALYLYLHPQTQAPVAEAPQVVAQAAPPPSKMYFHSPLDAGPMSTNASTGTGYYSADPASSRFNNGHVASASTSAIYGGYPVYYGGNTSINNTTINAAPATRSAVNVPSQGQSSYLSNRQSSYQGSTTNAPRVTTANQ